MGRYHESREQRTFAAAPAPHAAVASLWGGCLLLATAAASAFDTQPAEGVLKRLLLRQARELELGTLDSTDGRERFRISADRGRIRIAGTTPSALLFGAGWYLKYVAHVHFSESGDRLAPGALPLLAEPIENIANGPVATLAAVAANPVP